VALVVAAVLGVSGGIITAFVAPLGFGGGDRQQATPSAADPPFDPLDLGVALENVTCTGETLIMVGWGDIRTALSPSVQDWPGVKYLDTGDSCDTAYPPARKVPRYVAYIPAYDTPEEACEERMNALHKGNFVTKMRDQNKIGVQCACETALTALPAIGEGQPRTAESGMWIYLYQGMLNDIGTQPPLPRTGLFDDLTVFATRLLQTDAALSPSGIVDADTWNVLRNKACSRYDY